MNILVYNFLNESPKKIDNFLKLMDSSIFFAISFSDAVRILNERCIGIAFMRLNIIELNLLESFAVIHPKTKFYISSSSENTPIASNVLYFSPKCTLLSLAKKCRKY